MLKINFNFHTSNYTKHKLVFLTNFIENILEHFKICTFLQLFSVKSIIFILESLNFNTTQTKTFFIATKLNNSKNKKTKQLWTFMHQSALLCYVLKITLFIVNQLIIWIIESIRLG